MLNMKYRDILLEVLGTSIMPFRQIFVGANSFAQDLFEFVEPTESLWDNCGLQTNIKNSKSQRF